MAPHRFVGFVTVPLAIFIVYQASSFQGSSASGYTTLSYVTAETTALFFLGFGALALGSFLAASHARAPSAVVVVSPIALDVLFGLCLAGYCFWFVPLLVQNPAVFLGAISGEFGAMYGVRELAPNVSGITTLSQFGIAYCLLYADQRFRESVSVPRRYDVFFAMVVILAAIRALVNSERIALTEIVLPTLFVFFASPWSRRRRSLRIFRQTFPILLIVVAPVFFMLFEYNRSWINHYQYRYDSYLDFGLERISIYYSSAFNNMAGFMAKTDWPTWNGQNTLSWLYRFPIVGSLFVGTLSPEAVSFQLFLELYATEEFNNPTGILPAFVDWGSVGGAVYLFGLGGIYGYAFLCFVTRTGWLRHLFPLFLFAQFEVLRIDYIVDGRAVAAIIGLIVGRALCRSAGAGLAVPAFSRSA